MLHRIRVAVREEHGTHTTGTGWANPIEIDEIFIGEIRVTNMEASAASRATRKRLS